MADTIIEQTLSEMSPPISFHLLLFAHDIVWNLEAVLCRPCVAVQPDQVPQQVAEQDGVLQVLEEPASPDGQMMPGVGDGISHM